jgi:hypothetical protein
MPSSLIKFKAHQITHINNPQNKTMSLETFKPMSNRHMKLHPHSINTNHLSNKATTPSVVKTFPNPNHFLHLNPNQPKPLFSLNCPQSTHYLSKINWQPSSTACPITQK